MRRSATLLRSSRTQYSILPRSITLSRLATPTISAKARTEAGVYPFAAQGADRRHTRVVPAHDGALLHEFQQFAFRHHRVGQVQPRELVLVRRPDAERLDEPVVERTVDVEFERADRVGDVLDRVALPVGVVVHRVDAPLVARAVVAGMDDAVHDRVAEEHVGMRHVDLGAQHLLAVGELARLHAFEQVEVLLRRTVAPRRLFARLGDRAAAFADLLLRLVVDIGQPLCGSTPWPIRRAGRNSPTHSVRAPSRSPASGCRA